MYIWIGVYKNTYALIIDSNSPNSYPFFSNIHPLHRPPQQVDWSHQSPNTSQVPSRNGGTSGQLPMLGFGEENKQSSIKNVSTWYSQIFFARKKISEVLWNFLNLMTETWDFLVWKKQSFHLLGIKKHIFSTLTSSTLFPPFELPQLERSHHEFHGLQEGPRKCRCRAKSGARALSSKGGPTPWGLRSHFPL